MAESVTVPKELLRELYLRLIKVEEVLVTIEELMNKEGLERIHNAEQEYEKGEYIIVKGSEEIKKFISE